MAALIYLYHLHPYMLVQMHHLSRIAYIVLGELRYMHQSVLMYAYVHKRTEIGDVCDDAGQFHFRLQRIYGLYILVKFKFLYLFTWVTTWLLQFLHDIRQGRDTRFRSEEHTSELQS